MTFSMRDTFDLYNSQNFELHEQAMNHQFVRVLRTLGFDRRYTKAQGQYLFDADGNRYLDLLSGYGVFAFGRNHPKIISALKEALDAELPNLVQFDCPTLAGVFAKRLLNYAPEEIDKAFLCNSGTEAVEGAIKFARAATKRTRVLYWDHSFHGLSTGSLSLNGAEVFKTPFGPLLPGATKLPFNDLQALETELQKRDVAAFIAEPIQGKGVNIPDEEFFGEASKLCEKYGALMIFDEVQTGIGRTGKFFAFEHWRGARPDIITVAKALSGGFIPTGAILTKKWIWDKVFRNMENAVIHSSTFSKNNMAAVAGLATLDLMEEEKLVERAAEKGELFIQKLRAALEKYEFVKEVRGKGMMIGIEFGPPKKLTLKAAWTLLEKANKGLFCQLIVIPLFKDYRILTQVAGPSSYSIKLIPPLTITDEDITTAVGAIEQVVKDAHRFPGAIWELGTTLAGHAMRSHSANV